jgi:hypothetical protein
MHWSEVSRVASEKNRFRVLTIIQSAKGGGRRMAIVMAWARLKRQLPELVRSVAKERVKGYREKQDCCGYATGERIFEHFALKRKGRLGSVTRDLYIENRRCFEESQNRSFQQDLEARVDGKRRAVEEEAKLATRERRLHDIARDRIAKELQGRTEVACACGGLADVVSATTLCEVKQAHEWRHGLGQLLAYASDPRFQGTRELRLHLLGGGERLSAARRVCKRFGVRVTFEEETAEERGSGGEEAVGEGGGGCVLDGVAARLRSKSNAGRVQTRAATGRLLLS